MLDVNSGADIEFVIMKDGKRFGTLKVSEGAVVWRQKNYQYCRKIGWGKFTRLMMEFCHGNAEHQNVVFANSRVINCAINRFISIFSRYS